MVINIIRKLDDNLEFSIRELEILKRNWMEILELNNVITEDENSVVGFTIDKT